MKTVKVCASKAYEVKIGASLLNDLGAEVAAVTKIGTAAIISDSNVWPLYGEVVKKSLKNAGFSVISYVFPAGESSKNAETYLSVLNFLAENHVNRADCLIALGGGVVGDLTGFVAATYLRGISYIQVPTTLLAAVDSSVGGKTAIDLDCGKNLVGAFYQPKLVLCDTDTLNTLPRDIFRDGCAEIIKYGILYDEALFAQLEASGLAFDREAVIARCVELKRDVVAEDEFDTGSRMKLNLGHTIGHGVEASSHFTVSHGKAVAIGTAMISRAAAKYGICAQQTCDRVLDILTRFELPISTNCNAQTLFDTALSDKKRSGGIVNLIVPEKIGSCSIRPTPVDEVKAWIEAGL
ncbi:MAG: 3-dehydroquinate synthase [Ruminococcaceae bacterium]|nr:3-dehydroquinate synthase [Oscillospiraceae bacterium]